MTGQLADPADQIVPIMTAQRLVSELPHARLRLISDAGHQLPRRAPGAVAEAIAGFVEAATLRHPERRISFVKRYSAQTTVRDGSAVAPYAGSPNLNFYLLVGFLVARRSD